MPITSPRSPVPIAHARLRRAVLRVPLRHPVRAGVLALLLLVPASVLALDVSGVHFEERTSLAGAPLVLNGVGVRHATIFGIEVYVAGLYVQSATHDSGEVLRSDRTKQIVLVMKRDVGRDQIGPAMRTAAERAAGARAASLRTELDAFGAWIPAMHARDRLIVSYTPASALSVTSTATRTTFHGSAGLAEAVFGMWVGPRPVEDSLRNGLLDR